MRLSYKCEAGDKADDKQEFDKGGIGVKKLVAFVFALVCVLGLFGCSSEPAPVGIIGGAESPAAIRVTSSLIKLKWTYVYCFIGVIVVAILVALFIYCNKKKK